MSRIQRTISGTSYQTQVQPAHEPAYEDDGRDLDTADRLREGRERFPLHDTRETAMDARNQPRAETADYVWRRPTSLDAPPPRPGFAQRWVRAEMRAESDNLNWQAKFREGWRPRDPKTVPDCESFFNTTSHMGTPAIRVGGMVLMEIDTNRLNAKKRAIQDAVRRQEESVSMETAKISNDGVRQGFSPIVREEETSVATGRRPRTLAD